MVFDKDSVLVQAWVRMIELGKRHVEEVPALGNLQEAVGLVLEEL